MFTAALLLIPFCIGWSAANHCSGRPNAFTPIASRETLVAAVPNGKLFRDDQVNPPMHFIHVYGTPYEMGFAMGQLVRDKMPAFIEGVYKYLDSEIEHYLPNAPQWVLDLIEKVGVLGLLDLTAEWTKPYTPQRFTDELRGLAAGSGVDEQTLLRVNMIPEAIKAQCTMVGAWGPAIKDGSLYQLRALDWAVTGPFADYAAIVTYHPSEGYNFTHLAWMGFIGALTGYSSANVGICEKVWDHYNGTYFVEGYPFHYLLRDILQFDSDTSAAMNRIMNAKRTCSIYVGLGDSLTKQFRAVEYSHDWLNMYSDQSYPEYTGHPRKAGIVYINKHVQPSGDTCLSDVMMETYGTVDAMALINTAALHQTGDNHVAVYDFARNLMYVSSASSSSNGEPVVAAYDRQFLRLDLQKLWDEPAPTGMGQRQKV